jgi:periplasmic divalent cation tolerance protein
MKAPAQFSIVFVTAPELKTARVLARAALQSRLVACANVLPKIESHYWWQGKIETSAEVLILFKTTKANLKALEKLIVAKHPYDTPEFLVLPIMAGNKRYLDWVRKSVTQ